MLKGITRSLAAASAMTQYTKTVSTVILLCFGAAVAVPMGAAAQPYSGTPAAVPGTIEAERFDRGGEGPGYYEENPANTGGAFRPNEGVDIRADPRAPRDNWIVTSFENGEWMAYTVNVATAGQYQWGLRAATAYSGSSYYLQVDGRNVTGTVTVPNTGNWDAFQWVPAPNVWLSQGQHVIKVVSNLQSFDFDLMVIFAAPAGPTQTLQSSGADFVCTFNSVKDCNFIEQAKVSGRASLTSIARDGGTALRLHTEPGDNNVVGSGAMERDDVYLAKPGTADPELYGEGVEQWWAHSILFPDDFVVPTTQAYTIFDFHNIGSGHGQANFNLAFQVQADVTQPALLSFIGYGGADVRYSATIGQIQKNVWYDFVYHVRWSSNSDGLFDAWVNGKKVLTRRGPTLYSGQSVYLKLANYHMTVCNWYAGCIGDQATSVIHDRIVRGTSAQAVSTGPLEGN